MKKRIKNFFGKLRPWFPKNIKIKKIILALLALWVVQMVFSISYIFLGCGGGEGFATDSDVQISETLKQEYEERNEESTYLTFPEWYIVYSAEELAEFDKSNKPSSFPYFSATRQFWNSYCEVTRVTKANYDFNAEDHIMLLVIGESFTIENTIKGVYENTFGRFFELFGESQEDRFAQAVNEDYSKFLHTVPWYEYPFHKKLVDLWMDTGIFGKTFLRKWERKLVLSVEYSTKSIYATAIKTATKSLYGDEDLVINAITQPLSEDLIKRENRIKVITEESGSSLIELPRYEEFTQIVSQEKLPFLEIAGNNEILLSAISVRNTVQVPDGATVIYSMPVLTKPDLSRLLLKVNVEDLRSVLYDLEKREMKLEHIYDY